MTTSETPKPVDGTVQERQAYTAARAAAARTRDEARLRHAEAVDSSARSIPHDDGYSVSQPGSLPGADAIVSEVSARLEELGEERLTSGKRKAGAMAKKLLPEEAFALDSPYMRFALSEAVVGPISAYLGVVPILNQIDIWYSAASDSPSEPRSSQLWHLDHADTTQVKVWVYCSDVGAESGPLTILPASVSDTLANEIGYDLGEGYRVTDDRVRETVGDSEIALVAPKGAVTFVDTSRCFHFGSRVEQGAPARRVFFAQYLTPYAFRYDGDHRNEASFRQLATSASSELERLLLGAD
jgi:hypothetical protein